MRYYGRTLYYCWKVCSIVYLLQCAGNYEGKCSAIPICPCAVHYSSSFRATFRKSMVCATSFPAAVQLIWTALEILAAELCRPNKWRIRGGEGKLGRRRGRRQEEEWEGDGERWRMRGREGKEGGWSRNFLYSQGQRVRKDNLKILLEFPAPLGFPAGNCPRLVP